MDVLVLVKQVPDTEMRIKFPDASATRSEKIDFNNIKFILSPYDTFAMEEAVLLKQKLGDVRVNVISFGPARVAEALRECLALGADQVFHVTTEEDLESFVVAQAVIRFIQTELPQTQLILTGKESIDDGSSQVPSMIAGLLGWPLFSSASKAQWEQGSVQAVCEQPGIGSVDIKAVWPLVLTADKGLNLPKPASLPALMKAKKMPVQAKTLESVLAAPEKRIKNLYYEIYDKKIQTRQLTGRPEEQVQALVAFLRNEVKVG